MVADTETTIFGRMLEFETEVLSVDAARSLLKLTFPPPDRQRMHELAQKSNQGTLTEEERKELDKYVSVGHMLGLMQSRSRLALKSAGIVLPEPNGQSH
jgi:hypothetical protein